MASYFAEHDCTDDETQPSATADLTSILRAFLSGEIPALSVPERLAPPASKVAVATLPRRRSSGDDVTKDCPVCLLPYSGEVVEMPCGHLFHGSCLEPWLEKTNSCPLCRFELVTDDRSYEEHRRRRREEEERVRRVEDLHHSMFG